MEENLMYKIAAWTNDEMDEATLLKALEAAGEDVNRHRTGFTEIVENLTPEQAESCDPLIAFANGLLEMLDAEIQEVADGLEASDKGRVITAGDMMNRASFQLNQTFVEFRNQALRALGPSDIPNYNHILSVKDDFLANPDDNMRLVFQEAIDTERSISLDSIKKLDKEPQIPEVISLTNAFLRHLKCLNNLSDDLAKNGDQADYDSHISALEETFVELQDLVPMVQVSLRAQGETDFPDLNYLFQMITEAETGNIGDGPLIEAMVAVEMGFAQTKSKLEHAPTILESALALEEVQTALKTFEDFEHGIQAVQAFLAERSRVQLTQARGYLLDFAKALSTSRERLKELEAMEGKTTCPRCATLNDSDRTRCVSCGVALPQNVGSTTTTTFEAKESGGMPNENEDLLMTANVVKLYEAVNGIHAGDIDDATFLSEIEKFENLVNANVTQLPPEPADTEEAQKEAVNRVYDAFEEGVEGFRQGTELLRSYLDNRDEEVLKEAVMAIDGGAKKIAAAGQAVAGATAAAT